MDDKNYYENLMEEYDTWKDLVRDLIISRLEEREGDSYYLCDLAYTLFEGENVDGSFTYSTYWSKELIKHYWDEFGELYDNYLFNMGGENSINVLEEPEKFVVVMLLEQGQSLLSNYDNDFIQNNWNEEIELNKENIEKIIESMEE